MTYNFCIDGFLAKLDSSGALVFSTCLGGTGDEQVTSIAVDPAGNIYAAGLKGPRVEASCLFKLSISSLTLLLNRNSRVTAISSGPDAINVMHHH